MSKKPSAAPPKPSAALLALFSEKELKTYTKAFETMDTQKVGLIPYNMLGTTLRLFGGNPSETEIAEMIKELDPERKQGALDFVMFLTAFSRKPKLELLLEEDIRESFRALDSTEDARIPNEFLHTLLTKLSEGMDEEEIGEFFRVADPTMSGCVDYEAFVSTIYAVPEKTKKHGKKKK